MKKFQQVQKTRTFEDIGKWFFPKEKAKVKFPRQVMIKYDGRHTTIVKHPDQTIEYFTSGGKVFELLDDQVFGFDDTPVGVYFAEMMGEGIEGRLGERIHSGIQTTMFTNTGKGLFNKHKPTWRIFDYITIADYDVGVCELPYISRWSYLKDKIPTNFLAYDMECETKAHWDMFHTKAVAEGWEGTVCVDHLQQWKASTSRPFTNIKRKDRKDADLLCIGVNPGTGKYEGMIGSLKLQSKTGIEVDVGSGMTDADRAGLHAYYIGSVVEIVYEQMMDTYIQPIFVRVRDDKTKEDIN